MNTVLVKRIKLILQETYKRLERRFHLHFQQHPPARRPLAIQLEFPWDAKK